MSGTEDIKTEQKIEENQNTPVISEEKDKGEEITNQVPTQPPSLLPSEDQDNKMKSIHKEKENSEETKASSKKRKNVNNPFEIFIPQVQSLVYWENPTRSGAVLGTSLFIVVFTSQVSLFNTFCALAVILLSANWIYVVGRKQFQVLLNKENVNPYEHYFVEKPWHIERPTVEKYLDTVVDGVNFILQESQKIVLVDDPMRTLKYVFLFYLAWTIGGWFSFHTLTTIALMLGFTTPLAYQRNKVLVDEKLEKLHEILNSYCERATGLLKHHTKDAVEKGRSFAVNKGWVKNSTPAQQKEE